MKNNTNRFWTIFVCLVLMMPLFAVKIWGQRNVLRDPKIDSTVLTLAQQTDRKILIGGIFSTVGGQQRKYLARLNSDGSLDTSFPNLNFNDTVRTLAIQTDGKILVGGSFVVAAGQTFGRIVRLNPDGSIDAAFQQPNILTGGQSVEAIATLPDGKILIGGALTSIDGQPKTGIARLNSNGTLDSTFQTSLGNTGFDPVVTTITIQPDGKTLFGGAFNSVNNQTRRNLARLNADGTLDAAFQDPAVSGSIRKIALQPDGRILFNGVFNSVGGQSRTAVVRINSDGSLDSNFQALNMSGDSISDLVLQANGKIIIGGYFTSVAGQPRFRIARLNADGSVDLTFPDPQIAGGNGIVTVLQLQADGKILAAGDFTVVGRRTRLRLARFDAAGTLEAAVPAFDYDADEKSDISVFRPATGTWYLEQSSFGFAGAQFGQNGDRIVPADYDGDGRTDLAVYRNGIWYLQRSGQGFTGISFGTSDDIPMPADFDGDGKADLAVFRPSTGVWYLQASAAGFSGVQFGQNGDRPVAADYDGDGRADIAVYRAGVWDLNRSTAGFASISFGTANDLVVPADYDGDGRTDVAVFRPADGTWYLQQSTNGFTSIRFGQTGDLPAAADFDGDGKTDVAVFRSGIWYLNRSAQGPTGLRFGVADDKPIPNAFVQ